jgi:hypothetical protein
MEADEVSDMQDNALVTVKGMPFKPLSLGSERVAVARANYFIGETIPECFRLKAFPAGQLVQRTDIFKKSNRGRLNQDARMLALSEKDAAFFAALEGGMTVLKALDYIQTNRPKTSVSNNLKSKTFRHAVGEDEVNTLRTQQAGKSVRQAQDESRRQKLQLLSEQEKVSNLEAALRKAVSEPKEERAQGFQVNQPPLKRLMAWGNASQRLRYVEYRIFFNDEDDKNEDLDEDVFMLTIFVNAADCHSLTHGMLKASINGKLTVPLDRLVLIKYVEMRSLLFDPIAEAEELEDYAVADERDYFAGFRADDGHIVRLSENHLKRRTPESDSSSSSDDGELSSASSTAPAKQNNKQLIFMLYCIRFIILLLLLLLLY